MRRPSDEDVLSLWKRLVVACGVGVPKPEDLAWEKIDRVWCPEGTTDALLREQQRPELKTILRNALDGIMEERAAPGNISRMREYKELAKTVDPYYEIMVSSDDIVDWCRREIESYQEGYSKMSPSKQRRLRLRFRKGSYLVRELKDSNTELGGLIRTRRIKEDRLEKMLNENEGDFTGELERLDARRGNTRMAVEVMQKGREMVGSINDLLREMVIKEIAVDTLDSDDIPEWLLILPPTAAPSEIINLLNPISKIPEERKTEVIQEYLADLVDVSKKMVQVRDDSNKEILKLDDRRSEVSKKLKRVRDKE